MSERNGDKSRFGRQRKAKIERRVRLRALSEALQAKGLEAKAPEAKPPKAKAPRAKAPKAKSAS